MPIPTRRVVIIAGAAALAVLLGLVVPRVVDVNRYRGAIESRLQDRLNRKVVLGEMTVRLFPPGVTVEGATLGEDPSFPTGRPFARVEEISVGLRLMPLISGRVELRAIELRAPVIELVQGNAGTWNVASLGTRDAGPSNPDAAFVLNRLVVRRGRFAVSRLTPLDGAGGSTSGESTRAVYEGIDLQVDNVGPDRVADVAVNASSPDGVVTGSARLRNNRGRLSVRGALRMERVHVRRVALGYPIAAEFDLSHDSQTKLLTIAASAVRLNETPIALTGTVDFSAESPLLDVHVTATDASLAEAARLASAAGLVFGAGTDVHGVANVDVRARGPARSPVLEGGVRLRDVSISGRGIVRPVQTPAIDLSLTPDAIRSNDFIVTTAGASVGVQVAIVRYATPTPNLDARIQTVDADVGAILSAAHAWGIGPEGVTGTGRMNLDVRATGPLDVLALTGHGTLERVALLTPAIAEPVRIASARLSFDRDTAVLDELTAGIGSTNATGRLTVRSFATPDIDFELAADRIDAREWQRVLSPRQEPKPDAAPGLQASGQRVLSRLAGDGRLRVGAITFDGLVFEEAQATVRLDRGVVRLDPLTAALFGGRHRGLVVMDFSRRPAVFTVSGALEGVDANRLASAVTSLQNVVYGAANATVHMTFAGDRAADLPRSMTGALSFALDEGRVTTLDLAQEIANIARVAIGKPKTERSTRVAALTGDFAVTNGVARTDNLTFSIDDGALAATGTIDLADQRVDLRLVAVLSNELLRRAGASRVGTLLTTSLVNERGEFIVPILIGGTMRAPRVAPDLHRLGELKQKPGAGDGEATPPGTGTIEKTRDRLRDLLERRKPAGKPAESPPRASP